MTEWSFIRNSRMFILVSTFDIIFGLVITNLTNHSHIMCLFIQLDDKNISGILKSLGMIYVWYFKHTPIYISQHKATVLRESACNIVIWELERVSPNNLIREQPGAGCISKFVAITKAELVAIVKNYSQFNELSNLASLSTTHIHFISRYSIC